MTPEQLSTAIVDVLTTLSDEGAITLPEGVPTTVTVERPRSKEHGDYATNVALQLGKRAGMNPRAFAELVQAGLLRVDGDELVGAGLASNRDDLLLVSRKGQSLRFTATDSALRPMGRSTSGVRGMGFRPGDDLLSMSIVEEGEQLDVFVVFENGRLSLFQRAQRAWVDERYGAGRGAVPAPARTALGRVARRYLGATGGAPTTTLVAARHARVSLASRPGRPHEPRARAPVSA